MMAGLMRRFSRSELLAAIALAVMAGWACSARAQSSGKSRADDQTADRVNAFAKLPNWSGIWELDAFVGQSDGQQFSAEGTRELKAYAAAMKPSFTPEYQAKFDEIHKKIAAAVAADPDHPPATHDPLCGPPPFPGTMSPGMYEWLATPEEVTFVSTVGAMRHIYTDGRKHPPADELWPTLMGDSIGHWEGDTLVVDTIATRKRLYTGDLSGYFVPMSDQLHFTERVHLADHNRMQIEYTVEDPVALTKPIHATITETRVTDFSRMVEETDCEQNERDPIVNGRFTTTVK
jgi:hypothetical protein